MKTAVPLAQLVKRDNLVKVLVLLDPTLTGCASESLWATRLGRDLYRIENIPFFAPDMALGDIIEAKMGVKGLQFRRSVKASGSRTVQVAFWLLSSMDEINSFVRRIEKAGAGVERWSPHRLALNIEEGSSWSKVVKLLRAKEQARKLEWFLSSSPVSRSATDW